jgi:imidazolonepropionase-like amidohydrolase
MQRLTCLLAWAAVLTIAPAAEAQVFELTGGNWFDGEKFVAQTVYSVDGVLRFTKPARVDETIDLAGGYVIPPFGEAHNHDLASGYRVEEQSTRYLWDGVYYVKLQSAFSTSAPAIRNKLEGPTTVDAVFAFAPVTGPGGHPIRLRETFFDRGYYEDEFESKEEIAGVGYTLVRDEADLDSKWPQLLAQGPDFIKFMLSSSEEYEFRRDDPEFFGHKGLDPSLAPKLVKKAHDAGLRITAHIDTGPDFHYAVAAGVDEIAHMPGRREPEVIREADARLAAEHGVTVITTLMLTTNIADDYPAWYERVMEQHKSNLERLRAAGVTLAVGSDLTFRDTSKREALLLHELGVFTNLELLKMWSENSPKTIFPSRRIGKLEEGYEASFLVLNGNPLEDFLHVTDIRRRFKQGQWLDISEPPPDEE